MATMDKGDAAALLQFDPASLAMKYGMRSSETFTKLRKFATELHYYLDLAEENHRNNAIEATAVQHPMQQPVLPPEPAVSAQEPEAEEEVEVEVVEPEEVVSAENENEEGVTSESNAQEGVQDISDEELANVFLHPRLAQDRKRLSEYYSRAMENIQVFRSKKSFVNGHGNNSTTVQVGQLGFRCCHCGHAKYTGSIKSMDTPVYRVTDHLIYNCPAIPKPTLSILKKLIGAKRTGLTGLKPFVQKMADMIDIQETKDGLFLRSDLEKKRPATTTAATANGRASAPLQPPSKRQRVQTNNNNNNGKNRAHRSSL